MQYLHCLGQPRRLNLAANQTQKTTPTDAESMLTGSFSMKATVENPLCGYKITKIKSSSRRTELFILGHDKYMEYVAASSPFHDLQEKQMREYVENSLGIVNASMR